MREIRIMEKIDHVAIAVTNIKHAVKWYTENRKCKVNYQDNPPHIAFVDESIKNGTKHRDGSESVYDHDTFGNIIERIKYEKSSKK